LLFEDVVVAQAGV